MLISLPTPPHPN